MSVDEDSTTAAASQNTPEDLAPPMRGRLGWGRTFRIRIAISDALVIALTMTIVHSMRFGWAWLSPATGAELQPMMLATAGIGVTWWLALGLARSREPRILGNGTQEYTRVLQASVRTFALVAVVGFLTQMDLSRGYLLIALPLGTALLLGYRHLWRRHILWLRSQGKLLRRLLVVGPRDGVEQLIPRLERGAYAGYTVAGVSLPPGTHVEPGETILGYPVYGAFEDPVAQAQAAQAEFIALAGGDAFTADAVHQLSWRLEGTRIGLIVAPAIVDIAAPRMVTAPVQGLPLMYVDKPGYKGGKYLLKAGLDRTMAALVLLVLALPMAVIALLVRLTSPGPALFKQERVGKDHESFQMLKFRSMYQDAEARLAELEGDNEGSGALFKMRNDPRVTPVGKWLRRFSLDELPQIINVLRGDMSVVGPRPPLQREVALWEDNVERRQLVKPGITGLWQVSGRSDLSWEESVRLDLYYTENWSFGGDLMIILRTIKAVVASRGAY